MVIQHSDRQRTPAHSTKRQGRRDRTRYRLGSSGPIRRELGKELIGELERMCRPSTVAEVLFLAADIATVALVAAAACLVGGIAMRAAAVIYIGFRQRYLDNLVHECSHQKLFSADTNPEQGCSGISR